MLIPSTQQNEKNYLVECAGWKSVINAQNPEDAATRAFEEALDKYQGHTEVSAIFTVLDLTTAINEIDIQDNIHFLYAPAVLANADMHETSKQLKFIIDNLQKNLE